MIFQLSKFCLIFPLFSYWLSLPCIPTLLCLPTPDVSPSSCAFLTLSPILIATSPPFFSFHPAVVIFSLKQTHVTVCLSIPLSSFCDSISLFSS